MEKWEYRQINHDVMVDTKRQYETNDELKAMVENSIARQFIVRHEQNIDQPQGDQCNTAYHVTGERTLDEALKWCKQGNKVAILNFANNHTVGGAPFAAGAQEESICRITTLFPCISALYNEFYLQHQHQYESGEINYMGNDDLIYTPDVCVFKKDIKADPNIPEMLPREDWYKVDVITCAAPELWHGNPMPDDYEAQITTRIKKIIDVARMQHVDALILGAWGCGAFKNPSDIVARVFHETLKHYNFKVVAFAMGGGDYKNGSFYKQFMSEKEEIAAQEEQIEEPEFAFSLNALQNGIMTYLHLYDSLNDDDKSSIGDLLFEAALSLEIYFEEDSEEQGYLDEILDDLTVLETKKDDEDINIQAVFSDMFVNLGRIRTALDYYSVQ